jgi:hypothetical protein
MLMKRAYRQGNVPDPQVTNDKLDAARMANLMCRHPRKAQIIGLPFYGIIYSKTLRARTSDDRGHAREEIGEALPSPASVDPVTEIRENPGCSLDLAMRSEIAQPEWLREFISRPGWVPSDDQEFTW